MKLIVDISDEAYELCKRGTTGTFLLNSGLRSGKTFLMSLYKSITNGTPLTTESLNGDCISRQAAIKTIWDGTNMDIYTSEVKEILEGLPSVQPEAKSEWIPIKTRPLTEEEKAEMDTESPYMYDCPLPDDGEEVEVTTYSGDVAMDIFCRDPEGCYFEHYCDDGDVLAWKHKPEPYKAESEDKGC